MHVRSRGYGAPTWGERHTAHLARLAEATGYQPTAWEQCQLGEARACAEAFGTLARTGCAVIVVIMSGMAAVLVWLLYH